MASTTTRAATYVAELHLQGRPDDAGERPYGVYLQNDGVRPYWLEPDRQYELSRDDLGWVVTCRSWPGGHTYRLAADGVLVDQLPIAGGGRVMLDAARTYAIRWNEGWALHEF